jgi:hypothetical protein
MNRKLLVTTIGVLTIIIIMVTVKPVLAFPGPPCQNCGASSLSPGTEAKSPLPPCQECGAKDFAPGHDAKSPGDAKDVTPGHEGQNAGIIGPSLKK